MATMEEALSYFRNEINKRTRFLHTDAIMEPPTDLELDSGIMGALDEINSTAPQTHFGLTDVFTNHDPRWKNLLVIGAITYALDTIISDWTANGVDAQIGDFSLPSKLGDYQALRSQFADKFTDLCGKLKASSQKFVKLFTYHTTPAFQPSSFRRYVNYNYSRMGRL